jgi:hypothetical protein
MYTIVTTGSWQESGVVQSAFNLNRPVRTVTIPSPQPDLSSPAPSPHTTHSSAFWMDSQQVVMDTIKPVSVHTHTHTHKQAHTHTFAATRHR